MISEPHSLSEGLVDATFESPEVTQAVVNTVNSLLDAYGLRVEDKTAPGNRPGALAVSRRTARTPKGGFITVKVRPTPGVKRPTDHADFPPLRVVPMPPAPHGPRAKRPK